VQGCNIVGNGLLAFRTSACHDSGSLIHAENNWWGVADSAGIEAVVYHHGDNPNYPTVVFVPFATGAFDLDPPTGFGVSAGNCEGYTEMPSAVADH
jgi:hypothetical protein